MPFLPRRIFRNSNAYLGGLLLFFAMGCSLSPEDAISRFNSAAQIVTQSEVKGIAFWIDAPQKGIQAGFAHGLADASQKVTMTTDTPFFSASVGKLFVAAAIQKLIADGRLSLDSQASKFIAPHELAGLPVHGGDPALQRITVAMLLNHRSGLPDYFSDQAPDSSPRIFDRIVSEPNRRWRREDLLDYTRDHYRPVGSPGERFHYSDINYDLLGMILEGVTGKPFHQVVREIVLEPLSLNQTWYHAFETPPAGLHPPADVWVQQKNIRSHLSLSADQAGGGLITTLADLRKFMRGLAQGMPVSLSALDSDYNENAMHSGIDVGRGVWRIRPRGVFFALVGLPNLVGHSGATGVWAYYVADWNTVLVGAVSDSSWQEKHIEFLLREILPILARTRNVTNNEDQ